MKNISKKEAEVMADLEFQKKYYFTRMDIKKHFKNDKQLTNTTYRMRKKGRIIKLNHKKYFLVPIKARSGKWTDNPLIVLDEMFDGKDYFVGGWYAAWCWKYTDQIPMQIDVYTTKRQGTKKILNKRYVFHRTTPRRIKNAVVKKIRDHTFRIISKEEAKKWIRLH